MNNNTQIAANMSHWNNWRNKPFTTTGWREIRPLKKLFKIFKKSIPKLKNLAEKHRNRIPKNSKSYPKTRFQKSSPKSKNQKSAQKLKPKIQKIEF